jgi:hypothetical protein
VLKKLLPHPGTAVLGHLELMDPVVDGSVKLAQGLFLLGYRLAAEVGHAWRSEKLTDAGVEVAPPGTE